MNAAQDAARVDNVALDLVTKAMRDALTGPAHSGVAQIVWSDRGAQLLLLVDSLTVQLLKDLLVVAVDTECIEYGITSLIVRFSLATELGTDPTGKVIGTLVAATDGIAHGHPSVAARWGELFRDVVWAAIVRLHVARAAAAGLHPGAIAAGDGVLQFAHAPVPVLAQHGPGPP